jgi:hypothetical protein
MTKKFDQLKTFLTNFNRDVVEPASRQSGHETWKKVQQKIKGFHSILQGYVNTFEQKNWSKNAGTVREDIGIRNIVDHINKTNLAVKAGEYKREHGEGGAKKR